MKVKATVIEYEIKLGPDETFKAAMPKSKAPVFRVYVIKVRKGYFTIHGEVEKKKMTGVNIPVKHHYHTTGELPGMPAKVARKVNSLLAKLKKQ